MWRRFLVGVFVEHVWKRERKVEEGNIGVGYNGS